MDTRAEGAWKIWQLDVTLCETNPAIWRSLRVPGNIDLRRLHGILQRVMGWKNSHLHLFKAGDEIYGEPNPEWGMRIRDESKARLYRIAPEPGDRLIYEYDMGDSWVHDVVVERVFPAEPNVKYPVCVDGRRACPPEDSGGVPGYENMLRVLANPHDEEHDSVLEWLGGSFDPEAFDLKRINRLLRLRWGKPAQE